MRDSFDADFMRATRVQLCQILPSDSNLLEIGLLRGYALIRRGDDIL